MLNVNTRSITERNWKSVKSTKNKLNLKPILMLVLGFYAGHWGQLLGWLQCRYQYPFCYLWSLIRNIDTIALFMSSTWQKSVGTVLHIGAPPPSRNRPTTLWTSSVYVKAGPTAFMGLGADLLWVTCHLTLLSTAVHLVGVLQAQ